MNHKVLIYATQRQRSRLIKQGIDILVHYDDYVLAYASDQEVADLQAKGYEVEVYEAAPVRNAAYYPGHPGRDRRGRG